MENGLSKWFPNPATKFLAVFYTLIVIWWITIFLRGIQETTENYSYSLVYGLIPLLWGLGGLSVARRWGGMKSSIGRAVSFLSAGSIAWGIGNLIYGYYNLVLRVPVPYPGWGDMGYILLYPLSAIGVIYFWRATGVSSALRRKRGMAGLLIIPLLLIILSYYLLFVVARGGELTYDGDILKLFLDVAYPVGDVIVVTLATILYGLSWNYLGGKFRLPIVIIIAGYILAYITDFAFSYTTTTETFFVGNWVDLLYPTTFFLITLGIHSLNPKVLSDQSKSTP